MTTRQGVQHRTRLSLYMPVVVWMGLIFFLSSQPDLPHPETGWADPVVSSGAHAFVFGVLAILWARALGKRPRLWLIAYTLTALYALSDEFHQAFVPGRTPDVLDLVCDGLGAALGLWAWAWWHRR